MLFAALEHYCFKSVVISGGGAGRMLSMAFIFVMLQNGEELCVKALIVFGADINARNVFQQTPLDIATHNQVRGAL